MDKDKEPRGKPNPLLDKQLDEILRNSERTYRRRVFWNRFGNGMSGVFRRSKQSGKQQVNPYGRLMLWGLLLVIIGMVLSRAVPQLLVSILVLGGIILFISPIFLSFRRPGKSGGFNPDEKYWRGRPVIGGDDPWRNTKEQFQGVIRWLRGGNKNQPRR